MYSPLPPPLLLYHPRLRPCVFAIYSIAHSCFSSDVAPSPACVRFCELCVRTVICPPLTHCLSICAVISSAVAFKAYRRIGRRIGVRFVFGDGEYKLQSPQVQKLTICVPFDENNRSCRCSGIFLTRCMRICVQPRTFLTP